MVFKLLTPVICLLLSSIASYGQFYFRIEADVSMKVKPVGEKGQLILGKVYYDRSTKKMVYDVRFPEREVWVMQDTLAHTFVDGELVKTDHLNPFIESTIFHKVLEGKLTDYGMRDSFYKVGKVEREEDMVITTWIPPENFPFQGKVLTSNKNNLLHGVAILDEAENVMSRQIFRNYTSVSGLMIPAEMIQVLYRDGQEVFQTINLTNILINNIGNESFYNHPLF